MDINFADSPWWAAVIKTVSKAKAALQKVKTLAIAVSDQLGGKAVSDAKFLAEWRSKKVGRNTLLLSTLRVGLCRHRAILFKACCDALGDPRIRCQLHRGQFKSEAHAWNVVDIEGEGRFVCDVMLEPGTLLDPDDDACACARCSAASCGTGRSARRRGWCPWRKTPSAACSPSTTATWRSSAPSLGCAPGRAEPWNGRASMPAPSMGAGV